MRQFDSIKSLASVNAPCVSIYMPTHKYGVESMSDSSRFNSLLRIAENELLKQKQSRADVDQIVANIHSLTSPHSYWQHRDQGLAIFATKEFCVDFNLSFQVNEKVTVSDYFICVNYRRFFIQALHFSLFNLARIMSPYIRQATRSFPISIIQTFLLRLMPHSPMKILSDNCKCAQ